MKNQPKIVEEARALWDATKRSREELYARIKALETRQRELAEELRQLGGPDLDVDPDLSVDELMEVAGEREARRREIEAQIQTLEAAQGQLESRMTEASLREKDAEREFHGALSKAARDMVSEVLGSAAFRKVLPQLRMAVAVSKAAANADGFGGFDIGKWMNNHLKGMLVDLSGEEMDQAKARLGIE